MRNLIFTVLVVFFYSCNSGSDNSKNTTTSAAKQVAKRDTVNGLGNLKESDTVYFKTGNGHCYLTVASKNELETELETKPEAVTFSATKSKKADAPATVNKPCDGEAFDGQDRKKAKLSVATATVEDFNTLNDLQPTLLPDDQMGSHHTPPISTAETSARVTEEKRNVHIKQAWIYAYAREGDEDYHVILGSTDNKNTAVFFNSEISGLPGSSVSDFSKLSTIRKKFQDFFGLASACSGGYVAFIDKPIPVEVTGSVLFDQLHYQDKSVIGTDVAKPKRYWEIHPITDINFL